MKTLYEAFQMIHAHGQGPFHKRVFAALDLIFEESQYALELYGKDGTYAMETSLPYHEFGESGMVGRTSELVQLESPMFHRLANGETRPMRLSDLMSQRQLRGTMLYHEIFRPLGIDHQIGIPIQSKGCLGGLTINRDHHDYQDENLSVAAFLAPQIATAFEVDQYIKRLMPVIEKEPSVDFEKLRVFGLSKREAEVMCWLMEGKRDAEISQILKISVRTVNHHVGIILMKLGVETRTAAVSAVLNRSTNALN